MPTLGLFAPVETKQDDARDVSQSMIRAKRSMEDHSKKMKWNLEDFNFGV